MKRLKRIARTWKYALGSFNDRKTKKYDNAVASIRTLILLTYLITNGFIIAGVIRHWNPKPPRFADSCFASQLPVGRHTETA